MATDGRTKFLNVLLQMALLVTALSNLCGQQPAPANLTITQAVEEALRNYPSIRVTQEQMNAAAAGIRLAQTAYLPRVDGLAQLNRATRNTYYGMLLPQTTIPTVDGIASNNLGSVWDSGAGILVTWQPFDFGLRAANVASARAEREHAQATVNRTQYDVSVATADAFLTVLAAQQTEQAAKAAVDSWQTLLTSIHAQVAAQLRPGADESRVQAELAVAQTQLAQSEQAVDVARATLAQFTGTEAAGLNLNPRSLLDQMPEEQPERAPNLAANPLATEQNAATVQAQAQLHATERSYFPQFSLEGSASARGTGLELDGQRLGGWNGLAPTTQNYGLGFTVTFLFMDAFAERAKAAQQAATVRASEAQAQLISRQLKAQWDSAQATLISAKRVSANTPVEVSSAGTALQQATARYRSGLAPVDDVAQAQRLLVQAQIDDSLARLNVWRAVLQVAAVRGDLQPFLAEATK